LTRPIFSILRRGRVLRGTAVDPFGWAKVRRHERRLITEYVELVGHIVGQLDARNHAEAVEIAGLVDMVRGYEHIKMKRLSEYRTQAAARMAAFVGNPEHR
jgi:indolepyruvate ferredoxin oxidoreductase